MPDPLKLMCVFAHPDDETLGVGSTLAKYATEGVETYLVVATRGERGWQGEPNQYPGPHGLGQIRTAELYEAADILGIREVSFLDYMDGDLDQADPAGATAQIVTHLRRVQPQVVLTFAPDGAYGHPDHIAISQFTSAALVCAADQTYEESDHLPAHRVAKFYYYVDTREEMQMWTSLFGGLMMEVDGVERRFPGWESWAVTTRIEAEEHWQTTWRAARCHQSQLLNLSQLYSFSDEEHRRIWSTRHYYRVYSLVNGGRSPETDLFAGLR